MYTKSIAPSTLAGGMTECRQGKSVSYLGTYR